VNRNPLNKTELICVTLVGKPEGEIPLGRLWLTWNNNIRKGLFSNSITVYYRKHNGIAQFYYEHVSQRCGESKSI
jgi:hypothetical protein